MILTGANMRAEVFLKVIFGLGLFCLVKAEGKTLWDFGVIIKEEQSQSSIQNTNVTDDSPEIKALISDPFVAPRKSTDVQFNLPVEIVNAIPIVTEDNFREVEKFIQWHSLQKKFNHIIQSLENSDLTALSQTNRAEIQFWMATSFVETGQFEHALTFSHWANSNRGSDRDLFLAAKIYEKTGDMERALHQYRKLMSLFPDSDYYHSAKIKSRIIARS
ncbi:MAG: tetratricopeptide repeat protein [Candidatus Marinimicrobia bacterium]|jgi:hypothetical protein|nr:tetratricopeptide repeat protein [Candidatus Neomarinimicrobiota bacterium]